MVDSLCGRPPTADAVNTLLHIVSLYACGAYSHGGRPTPARIESRPVIIDARLGEQTWKDEYHD